MTRPAEARAVEPELPRFGRTARWVHGLVGVLMLVCLLTAAVLYNSSLQVLVGHRRVVELVHVWCGSALPVPLVLGLASAGYRAELRRLDRFTSADWRWLRSRTRRDGRIPVGKFNAGQKLNGSLSTGAIGVLLLTGVVMLSTDLAPLSWRTGATLVHDWTALAVGLLVLGHLSLALRDPVALRSLRTGTVPRRWAETEHPAWAAEFGQARDGGDA
ncbi:cytochrome b/b6 domain-containing protein [Modestobacter altitudinis]|uniref:cytochrome b/b6 domain-containing protein n=1 Tax=Modestobacter altitudinis TaxID=2213158 RepID=UPI00110CFB3E|nr:cytochrome b/b6 domain-containing protein [Modestobacter altitudinis]